MHVIVPMFESESMLSYWTIPVKLADRGVKFVLWNVLPFLHIRPFPQGPKHVFPPLKITTEKRKRI